ncbi:MAG: EutN/CcmL family microcompartment protein [Candidatus Sumerlaeia bacterium]|nr:EutN/CcmL family microcompartment protein [Candidatus Sumerlaeia bacterium]
MILGRIVGTVVATRKDEGLEGTKLLVVQHCDPAAKPLSAYTIAADGVGAGEGDVVLVVTGSSARMASTLKNRPLDASIIAIVDTVEIEGKTSYRKGAGG